VDKHGLKYVALILGVSVLAIIPNLIWGISVLINGNPGAIFQHYIFGEMLSITLFRVALPTTVLTVLTVKLIIEIRKRAKIRREMQNSQTSQDDSISVVLVAILLCFLFSQICVGTDWLCFFLRAPVFMRTLQQISSLARVFNSAVNFYLYLLLYRNFRVSFLKLFGVEKQGQKAHGTLSATSSLASSINTIAKTVSSNDKEYINDDGFNTRL
jgi:hypothetical protein